MDGNSTETEAAVYGYLISPSYIPASFTNHLGTEKWTGRWKVEILDLNWHDAFGAQLAVLEE